MDITKTRPNHLKLVPAIEEKPTYQAIVLPRQVSIGDVITEGGYSYIVKGYEAIRAKATKTKRVRHLHWCLPL